MTHLAQSFAHTGALKSFMDAACRTPLRESADPHMQPPDPAGEGTGVGMGSVVLTELPGIHWDLGLAVPHPRELHRLLMEYSLVLVFIPHHTLLTKCPSQKMGSHG